MTPRPQRFTHACLATLTAGGILLGCARTATAAPADPVADPFIPPAGGELAAIHRQPRALAGLHAAAPQDRTLEVDDDLAQCPKAQYTTIQGAVNAAALLPGRQKIHVCAGIYAENVSIGPGNSLDISGDGAGQTIVAGIAGTAGPIIGALNAGRVDISALTVDGGSLMAGDPVYGIRYTATAGTISQVEVLNIRDPDGISPGVGIFVAATGAPAQVAVRGSLVQNYTRVGIQGDGDGVKLDVRDNQVLGPVPPRIWAPNGIQLSRGAAGQVGHNAADNNLSPNVPGGAASGIILFCAGSAHVHDNLLTRADLGITIADNAGSHVHNNEIADSGLDGISLQFIGSLFGNTGCTSPLSPTRDNFVHNNDISDSGEIGISLANFDPQNAPETPDDNRVSNNRIEGSGISGILVFDGRDNTLNNNRIKTSGVFDAVDNTTGGGTAGTANAWRNNRCASSMPSGLCR